MQAIKFLLVAVITTFLTFTKAYAIDPNDIVGRYWNPDRDGIIEIFKTGRTFSGRIIWSAKREIDTFNPNASLKGRNMLGVPFLKGFKFDGKGKWVDGSVYAFDNGRTYSGNIRLDGNKLKMRGFVGVSLLGRTVTFIRYPNSRSLPSGGFSLKQAN